MTEISKQAIQIKLIPLSDKSNGLYQRLRNEENNMQEALAKVRSQFCDQPAGEALTIKLVQAIKEVQCAYCEMEQLRAAIIEYARVFSD